MTTPKHSEETAGLIADVKMLKERVTFLAKCTFREPLATAQGDVLEDRVDALEHQQKQQREAAEDLVTTLSNLKEEITARLDTLEGHARALFDFQVVTKVKAALDAINGHGRRIGEAEEKLRYLDAGNVISKMEAHERRLAFVEKHADDLDRIVAAVLAALNRSDFLHAIVNAKLEEFGVEPDAYRLVQILSTTCEKREGGC